MKKNKFLESGSGETNYLANVSDLMCAFLFVVLLALFTVIAQLGEFEGKADVAKQAIEEQKRLQTALKKKEELFKLEKQKWEAQLSGAKRMLDETQRAIEEQRESLKLSKEIANRFEAEKQRWEKKFAAEKKLWEAEKKGAQKEIAEVHEYLEDVAVKIAGSNLARTGLLEKLREGFAQNGVNVEVDPTNGVLRIPENAITFRTGSAQLEKKYKERIYKLRDTLEKELECYSEPRPDYCPNLNPGGHTLDAVLIEGHTDNQPFGTDLEGTKNRSLSTERANTVYSLLLSSSEKLKKLKNKKGEALFSLSGYGEERPLEGHKHTVPTSDEANRRIEIRFLMAMPELSKDEFERIKERFRIAENL